MSGKAVGRTAASLPWLCPNTDSLIRLAEAPATLARPCGADPALLAFLLRFTPSAVQPINTLFCQASLAGASLPDAAGAYLAATRDGWIAPSEVSKRCRALVNPATALARRLAEHTRRACPDRAFAVAALAPLGWLAVAAVDSSTAAEPLHDPDTPPIPSVQADVWGLDQNAIARRLANRWRLPDWIASSLGNFSLPLLAARTVVSDVGMFAVVQLAVLEAERRGQTLGITTGADRVALLKELAITDATVDEFWEASRAQPEAEPQALSVLEANPHKVPLISNLLKMAAESRRRNGASLVARLEDRLDELHRGVSQVGSDAEARARDSKLAALAELAAGAGHEINNPLAIISGNAQRLFRTEPEPDRGESLQTIIRHTERIAGIIRDLMQFARPSRPNPHRCAASVLLQAVRDELAAFAEDKGVRVELTAVPATEFLRCDFAQVKQAILALVKNGIEAAGRDGWVRLSCLEGDDEFVRLAVEDSGPGLTVSGGEHAFDPFYCGRNAGRGRGLGLPTAWQYVRQNGGELRHELSAEGPTRFALTIPRSITLEFPRPPIRVAIFPFTRLRVTSRRCRLTASGSSLDFSGRKPVMRRVAASFARNVLQWVYPNTCLICDALERDADEFRHGVCRQCHAGVTTDRHSACPWCTQTVGPHTDTTHGCPECRGVALGFERAFRLGAYEGKLRDAVLRIKFLAGEGLADLLGRMLADARGAEFLDSEVDLVAPVPLHWWRKWTRGYNQSESVARELAAAMKVAFAPKLLRRVRWTPQQIQPTREARRENVKGAFRVTSGARLASKTVLLVDDVMTTGSTLGEAARTLRDAGAERVVVAVLARR